MQLTRRPKGGSGGGPSAVGPRARPAGPDDQDLVGNSALAAAIAAEPEAASKWLASELQAVGAPTTFGEHDPSTPAADDHERGEAHAQSSDPYHGDQLAAVAASSDSSGGAGSSGSAGGHAQATAGWADLWELVTDNGFQLGQELTGTAPSGALGGALALVGFWQGAQQMGRANETIMRTKDWSPAVDWTGGAAGVLSATATMLEIINKAQGHPAIRGVSPVAKLSGAWSGGVATAARGDRYVKEHGLLGQTAEGTPRGWVDYVSDAALAPETRAPDDTRPPYGVATDRLVLATLGATVTGIAGYATDVGRLASAIFSGPGGSGSATEGGTSATSAASGASIYGENVGWNRDASGGPAPKVASPTAIVVTADDDAATVTPGPSTSTGDQTGSGAATGAAGVGSGGAFGERPAQGEGGQGGKVTVTIVTTYNDDGTVTIEAWANKPDGSTTYIGSETYSPGADGRWYGDKGGSLDGKPPEGPAEVVVVQPADSPDQTPENGGKGDGDKGEEEGGDGTEGQGEKEGEPPKEEAPAEEAPKEEEESPETPEGEGRPSPLSDETDPNAPPLWMLWDGVASDQRRDEKLLEQKRGGGHTDPTPLADGAANPNDSQALALALFLSELGRNERAIEAGTGGHEGGGRGREVYAMPTPAEMKALELKIAGGGAVDPAEPDTTAGGERGPQPLTGPGSGIAPAPGRSRLVADRARLGAVRAALRR